MYLPLNPRIRKYTWERIIRDHECPEYSRHRTKYRTVNTELCPEHSKQRTKSRTSKHRTMSRTQ